MAVLADHLFRESTTIHEEMDLLIDVATVGTAGKMARRSGAELEPLDLDPRGSMCK